MAFDIDSLLRFGAENGASDVFLKADAPPTLRLHGHIRKLDHPPLKAEEIEQIARIMMTTRHWEAFENHPDHDLSYMIPEVARFRVNFYKQRNAIAMVLRIVSLRI